MDSKTIDRVLLIGRWYASYTKRVEVALKIKGIPYEYVEDDTTKKSELVLKFNPIHKKVPILVHNDHPIAESLVILECIDEQWRNGPKLLPEDPYHRAKVRFWAKFYDEKVKPASYSVAISTGEDQEKAIEDYLELLKVFMEGTRRDFGSRSPFYEGDSLGVLGIMVGANAGNYQAFNEACGLNMGPDKCPEFYSLVDGLREHPVLKETLPPHTKLVARLKSTKSK